jgi:hypothetical protein
MSIVFASRNVLLVSRSASDLSKVLTALHSVTRPFRLEHTHRTQLLISNAEFGAWAKQVLSSCFPDIKNWGNLDSDGAGQTGFAASTESDGSEDGDDDDHDFDIDLDASVGRVHHLIKHTSTPSMLSGGTPNPNDSLGRAGADLHDADWFNSPVKQQSSPKGTPEQGRLPFATGQLPVLPPPAQATPDRGLTSKDLHPIPGLDSSNDEANRQVFFAATTASRVRQQNGEPSPFVSPILRKMPPTADKSGDNAGLSGLAASYRLAPSLGIVSSVADRATPPVSGIATSSYDDGDASFDSSDEDDDNSAVLALAAQREKLRMPKASLTGVLTSVYATSSLGAHRSQTVHESGKPLGQLKLHQCTVVVDIDCCQVNMPHVVMILTGAEVDLFSSVR